MTIAETGVTDRQTGSAPHRLHRVTVARRDRISDRFVRVTFTGSTLDRFADPGLDQRIKLVLPAQDGTLDAMPLVDDWFTAWRALPDERRPVLRTYTTRAVRPQQREVDVDLVLHTPAGPAGRFASTCSEGDELMLLGPSAEWDGPSSGIDFRLPESARRILVAADETALPAVTRILEALPARIGGTVLVEVPHVSDGAQLPVHPGVDVRLLVRGDAEPGALLVPAVRASGGVVGGPRSGEPEDVDVDAGLLWEVPGDGAIPAADAPGYAWLAGEAGVIKTLRRMLVGEFGLDRRAVAFLGYWRSGRPESG